MMSTYALTLAPSNVLIMFPFTHRHPVLVNRNIFLLHGGELTSCESVFLS